MLSFSKDQEILQIGALKIGGQPGELPTVLFGTVFYGKKFNSHNQEVMEEVGSFISKQNEMSEMTGNPGIVDIFIGSEEHVEKRISFVLDSIQENMPFALDIPESGVRQNALAYAGEVGILDRIIYNSLNLGIEDEELEAMSQHPPGTAIVLGYNPRNMSTDGRLDILENGGGLVDKGLLEIARDVGIKNLLLDTGATPFDHNVAETLRSIPVMKNKWGLPVGCAIHNTVESWLWMKRYRKEHRQEYLTCDIGANAMPVVFGADYCVYGPMRNANLVFPFVAMVDKFVAEGALDYFGIESSENHPKRRLD